VIFFQLIKFINIFFPFVSLGSSFTKSKPGYHWTQVTATGFFKLVFFPIYFKW